MLEKQVVEIHKVREWRVSVKMYAIATILTQGTVKELELGK